ncbi:MAG: hypothetical protein O2943_05725 [Actinomycetota bacterium]|nr:hypothetical protein [Actinomycetota bacterium]
MTPRWSAQDTAPTDASWRGTDSEFIALVVSAAECLKATDPLATVVAQPDHGPLGKQEVRDLLATKTAGTLASWPAGYEFSIGHGMTMRTVTRVWAYIGLNSFGGPAGQIAVLHRELVEWHRRSSAPPAVSTGHTSAQPSCKVLS